MSVFRGGRMKQDKIVKLGKGTIIQHGDLNKRIYLMKLNTQDLPDVIHEINSLARKNKYTKIFCKVPQKAAPQFLANGFFTEAQIPGFYKGKETAFFVSKFLSSDRLLNIENEKLQELSELLSANNNQRKEVPKNEIFTIKKLELNDSEEMAAIYKEVFLSYPFPIHDPDYLKKTMLQNVQYFGASYEGRLVALASAELDKNEKNAEMTDFATLKNFRGKKLAILLLSKMEEQMKNDGIKTLYTIARLNSIGMNLTFLRLGYNYSGTAIKNTNISGNIESMNIYYKQIQ